jgi:bacillopeptidase F
VWTSTPITLTNTILAGNTVTEIKSPYAGGTTVTDPSDCSGPVSGGYSLIRTTAGAGDITGVDPRLSTLQGNGGWTMTREPQPGSPVVDAANPAAAGSGGTACNGTDQRGLPRSDDGNLDGVQRCDIGAVEMEAMDSDSYRVRFDAWSGFVDAAASGGGYRAASTAGATATFAETGSTATASVALMTFKGPNMGRAAITVDGVSKGTIDLYAAGSPSRATFTFSATSATAHSVVVRVLGTKNAASSGTQVRVDGFKRGSTLVDDTSPSVRYGCWDSIRSGRALGGNARVGSAGGTLVFDTVGPVFTFITERGPAFGKARVTVDGVNKGTVDCYSPTERWLSRQTYGGLGAGQHHVVIDVLGTKNAASSGTTVVFDGITLR